MTANVGYSKERDAKLEVKYLYEIRSKLGWERYKPAKMRARQ
jgi:hypothetical protein